jgi:hypothetical protein
VKHHLIERGKEMKKKDLILSIVNLAEHCSKHVECKSCELGLDKNKCMLRNLTLPEVIAKISIPKSDNIVWIKLKNSENAAKAMNKIKNIAEYNSGWNRIYVYAEEENSLSKLSEIHSTNDNGIELLKKEYGEGNVCIQPIIRGV